MPFTIIRQDITRMETDAIVNAANTSLAQGGGVCGAIFNAAGASRLREACQPLAPVRTGLAAVTPAFGLKAKYIIHAVGPIYDRNQPEQSARLLRSAYLSSLMMAVDKGCESITFPLISSGIYGFPKIEALEIATRAIEDFLDRFDMDIYLAVFDRSSFEISRSLAGSVSSYISQHYVDRHSYSRTMEQTAFGDMAAPTAVALSGSVDEAVARLDRPFSQALLELIDSKGRTDVEVYKRANIDRKLFSKIRKGGGYTPKKPTILALAIALELDLEETADLLSLAGYALSHASVFDVIVEYFIINRQYDIFEINQVLFKYDQPLLGA